MSLKIFLKNKSEQPIYEQIEEQVKEQILSGDVKENEQLPSVRSLAKELKIGVITTTRAYSDLCEQGYIVPVAGKGYFVAERNNELMRERIISEIENDLESAINKAKIAMISNDELLSLLKILMEDNNE